MTVLFTGLGSAANRTLFTHRGPIVKKPIQLIGGNNLTIIGSNLVSISTMPFSQSNVGQQLIIFGTPSGRNDGTFYISKVISSLVVELSNANFSLLDEQNTIEYLLALSNELQYQYNIHINSASHVNPDVVSPSNSGFVVDTTSAIILLNGLRSAFSTHLNTVFSVGGHVHIEPNVQNLPQAVEAYNLSTAILLANNLRKMMELHRQNDIVHLSRDTTSRVVSPEVIPIIGTGPLVGPFTWIIQDPRSKQVADDPSDVIVRVNNVPVTVDSVFGLLGAIVLTNAPSHGDSVTVDYDHISNLPTRFERLNTPEFVLNGYGNNAVVGLPGHTYRARSYLIDPSSYDGTIGSANQPLQTGWKYKGLERAYTAVLNDPNTLLFNVPGNRVSYPVFEATVQEITIRYDPITLPNEALDPWILKGSGVMYLAPGGHQLTLSDVEVQSGPDSDPPFYTHDLNLGFPSTVSAAFRMSAESRYSNDVLFGSSLLFGAGLGFTAGPIITTGIQSDGVMVGPGFGFTDGSALALVGLLETNANNLSSAISRVNTLKDKFNSHLVTTGIHRPDSGQDAVDIVSATNQVSLIILVNRLKYLYNRHIDRGVIGDGVVHKIADTINVIVEPDAFNIETAISLVNIMSDSFNAHRTQIDVHYVDDPVNSIGPVRQVGILTIAQFPELETSWVSSAFDWTITATYRLHKDESGDVYLYEGGNPSELAYVPVSKLPAASDIDLRIDPIQQTFFGSLSRQATSVSYWNFARVNVTPLSFDQIVDNKSVLYQPIDVPEKDSFAPWITIGQGGFDRIVSGKLILDSTSSALAGTESALGLSTGAYRGFLRLEPVLQNTTESSVEFTTSVGFYTFSLDNRSSGVFIDDGELSVHLLFLQAVPTPATVTGITSQPFPVIPGDTIVLSIDGGLPQTITFTQFITDAVTISNIINSQLTFALASAVGNRIRFTNQSVGFASSIQIISGRASEKIGMPVGTYFGRDSNSELKVSWFGGNYPELEGAPWIPAGFQPARLFGRTLQINDSSSFDYRAYSFNDPLYLNSILKPTSDWKFDFRCAVISCNPGDPIPVGTSLRPCGVLVNVDEGPLGKNVELHLAQDSIGQQYVNILSFNGGTNSLVSVVEMPFAWNDGKVHSFDIYTSKMANICIVLADNISIGTFTYSLLQAGISGPEITFGSGSEPVANADLRSSQSVVNWSSVCVFQDSKISDPLAESRRYIGLYKGGNPELLKSYYLHQVDWTQTHKYRIVRNPTSFVSVYVDDSVVPSISVNYNVLTLPPSSSSFLREITNSRNAIAFGSFNPFEIDRTIWGDFAYSIGKITLTERRVPGHQVTNYANVVTSPDHLLSKSHHQHHGFGVWSGGSPSDDNMAGSDPAFTVLGDRTPPVPMTQDLESRGGLIKVVFPVESVPSEDLVNYPGFLSDLENDTFNIIGVVPFTQQLIIITNSLNDSYNRHLTASGFVDDSFGPVHLVPDTFNPVALPVATDLASSITLLNALLSAYNAHTVEPTVHQLNDTFDFCSAVPATDSQTAYQLAVDLTVCFNQHLFRWKTHLEKDFDNAIVDPDPIDLATLISYLITLRSSWNEHVQSVTYHSQNDKYSVVPGPDPTTLLQSQEMVEYMRVIVDSHLLNLSNLNPQPIKPHPSTDFLNSPATFALTDLATTISGAVDVKNVMNGHFIVDEVHFAPDGRNAPIMSIDDPTINAIAFINDLKNKYNKHVVQYRVHVNNDPDHSIIEMDAFDFNSAVELSSDFITAYNLHRTAVIGNSGSHVHTNDDTTNSISPTMVVTLDDFLSLCFVEWEKYSAHLVGPGFHGSSVFIRLDPPDRVLYEGMRFFTQPDGEAGLVYPFSDDETLHMDRISMTGPHSVGLTGRALPEQAQLIGARQEPFIILGNGILSLTIDGVQTDVQLQPTDTTVNLVVAQVNSYFMSPVCFDVGDGRISVISPLSGVPISASGYGATSLGLEVPGMTSWALTNGSSPNVSVSLVAAGPITALRYESSATETTYRTATGLPDSPSFDFEVAFSVRIQQFTLDSNGDTGIYAGIGGSVNSGFTVGIGFEEISGKKFVKLQNLEAADPLQGIPYGITVYRIQFDWDDGNFHEYKIIRNAAKNSMSLVIIS